MGGHGIGIDIGGTQLRAALVTPEGTIVQRDRRPTPADDPTNLLGSLAELVTGLREQIGAELPVGIGMAGLVTGDGEVRYGPNIAVRDLPLAATLRESVGGHVVVANDASVAALGEQRAGAGAGVGDLILATLGTGVGGGLVVGGRLLTGASGFAGEVGHVVVSEHGRPCPCGNRGCLEAYASGTAIGALARDRLVDPNTVTSLRDLEYVGGKEVTAAARSGDRIAREVLEEAGSWLGVAFASLVNVLDPELIRARPRADPAGRWCSRGCRSVDAGCRASDDGGAPGRLRLAGATAGQARRPRGRRRGGRCRAAGARG